MNPETPWKYTSVPIVFSGEEFKRFLFNRVAICHNGNLKRLSGVDVWEVEAEDRGERGELESKKGEGS